MKIPLSVTESISYAVAQLHSIFPQSKEIASEELHCGAFVAAAMIRTAKAGG
jgi:hypothetical protein